MRIAGWIAAIVMLACRAFAQAPQPGAGAIIGMGNFSHMRLKALILGCLVAAAAPVTAHHGTSLYDMEKEIVLTGTVKEWSWRSPHTWLTLQVPASQGAVEEWSIESAPPAYMARQGWSATTFKSGEKIAVTISLLKGAPKAGILLEAARDNGEVLIVRPRGSFGRKQ